LKFPEIFHENSVILGNSRWEFLEWQIPGNSWWPWYTVQPVGSYPVSLQCWAEWHKHEQFLLNILRISHHHLSAFLPSQPPLGFRPQRGRSWDAGWAGTITSLIFINYSESQVT